MARAPPATSRPRRRPRSDLYTPHHERDQVRSALLEPVHGLAFAARSGYSGGPAGFLFALDMGPSVSHRRRPARAELRRLADDHGLGGAHGARPDRPDGRREPVP